MKYLEYMENHDGENLSWCKPYTDDSGDYKLIMYNGEVNSISAPDYEAFRYNGSMTPEIMEKFARAVNRDYDLYSGWEDWQIALEGMHETGCSCCPWRGECDAMAEEMNDGDYR